MKNINKLLLICLFCFNTIFSIAQQGDTLEIKRNEKGKISFARFKQDADRKIQESANFINSIMKAKPDDELRLIKESTDELGTTHRFYQQYFKGIKVEDGQYSTLYNNFNSLSRKKLHRCKK